MPNFSPFTRAYSRQSMRTTQPRHTSLASRVEAPRSGKKRSGSTPKQFAWSCQLLFSLIDSFMWLPAILTLRSLVCGSCPRNAQGSSTRVTTWMSFCSKPDPQCKGKSDKSPDRWQRASAQGNRSLVRPSRVLQPRMKYGLLGCPPARCSRTASDCVGDAEPCSSAATVA